MPADGKGPKGGDVMSRTHATGSALSYARRYLLLMIFNISVGGDDDDGNRAGGQPDPRDSAQTSFPPITESQLKHLTSMMKEADVAEQIVLEKLKVSALKDLNRSEYSEAIEKCKTKLQ